MAECSNELDCSFTCILEKLKELNCLPVEDGKDLWISDLLFSPSFQRYELLKWILEKLDCRIDNLPSFQSSLDDYIQYLLLYFSSLGFCKKTDEDLVSGHAKKCDQLLFWKSLVDVLWVKAKNESEGSSGIVSEKDEERYLTESIVAGDHINQEFLKNCCIVEELSASVNLSDLFDTTFSLPPDIENELKFVSDSERLSPPSLKEMRKKVSEKKSKSVKPGAYVCENSLFSVSYKNSDVWLENIPEMKELYCCLHELRDLGDDFTKCYEELKSVLHITKSESVNSGQDFENLYPEMEEFSRLLGNLSTIMLSSSKREIQPGNFQLANLEISGEKLKKYIEVFQDSLKRLKKVHHG